MEANTLRQCITTVIEMSVSWRHTCMLVDLSLSLFALSLQTLEMLVLYGRLVSKKVFKGGLRFAVAGPDLSYCLCRQQRSPKQPNSA